MVQVRQTDEFAVWLRRLKDAVARSRIEVRLRRLQLGLLGDAKFFDGIGELRVDYGPGYRLYFLRRGEEVIVLLCGGDKSSQRRDISRAKVLAEEYEDGS